MEVIAGAADAPTDTNPKAAATETLIVREVWRICIAVPVLKVTLEIQKLLSTCSKCRKTNFMLDQKSQVRSKALELIQAASA